MKTSLFYTTLALLAAGSLYLVADDHYVKPSMHTKMTPVEKQMPESKEAVFYKNECGACHMAYQPGLLPTASWTRVMATHSFL